MTKFGVLAALIYFITSTCWALEGRFINIHDGDTLTILDANNIQHKIRVAQIDAPELGQPWGRNSRQALKALVATKTVKIVVVGKDRYRRTVGTVFLGEKDICRELVATGNAWLYRKYLTDQSLLAEEESAKNEGEGLWS